MLIVRAPIACGLKVTMMVQLPLLARGPPVTGQVPPVIENCVTEVR